MAVLPSLALGIYLAVWEEQVCQSRQECWQMLGRRALEKERLGEITRARDG